MLLEGLNVLIENEIEITIYDPPKNGPCLLARVNPHNSAIDIRALHDYVIRDCIINVPVECSRVCNDEASYLYGTSFEITGLDFCYTVRTNGLSDAYTFD